MVLEGILALFCKGFWRFKGILALFWYIGIVLEGILELICT